MGWQSGESVISVGAMPTPQVRLVHSEGMSQRELARHFKERLITGFGGAEMAA